MYVSRRKIILEIFVSLLRIRASFLLCTSFFYKICGFYEVTNEMIAGLS